MAKDVLEGIDPEVKDVLQEAMNRCVATGKVTQKQIRESRKNKCDKLEK